MKKYRAVALCVLAFIACKTTELINIAGGPYRLDLQNGDSTGYIDAAIINDVDPGAMIVTVNGFDVPAATDTSVPYYFRIDSMPRPGMVYNLTIQTDIGARTACCTVPGNFHITEPADGITIDTSLLIAWDDAVYSHHYDVYAEMLYFDTSSSLIFKDTIVSTNDNHITLGQHWFADLAGEGDIIIKVLAVNETDQDSDDTDGLGTWSAMHGRHKTVTVYKR